MYPSIRTDQYTYDPGEGTADVWKQPGGREDFERTVALYQSNPEIINYLSNIVGAQVPIREIKDMNRAFEAGQPEEHGKDHYDMG